MLWHLKKLLCVECLMSSCSSFSFARWEKPALTEADGSQQTQAALWREAGGEQWLQHVVGKGQRNHGLVGRVNDQHSDPETQEPEGRKRDGMFRGGEWQTTRQRVCGPHGGRSFVGGTWLIIDILPFSHVEALLLLELASIKKRFCFVSVKKEGRRREAAETRGAGKKKYKTGPANDDSGGSQNKAFMTQHLLMSTWYFPKCGSLW